jgi:hypothetical protein
LEELDENTGFSDERDKILDFGAHSNAKLMKCSSPLKRES